LNQTESNPYNQNDLLRLLPRDAKEAFLKALDLVKMPLGEEVVRADGPLQYVHFPIDCLLSVVSQVSDGKTVETMMIGLDGLACIESLLDIPRASSTVVVQVAGQAFRMPARQFSAFLNEGLRSHFAPYAFTWLRTAALTSGCLAFHQSDKRLARWLLVVMDSLKSDHFAITHEYLGTMLGVQRPTVSLSMKALADKGALSYRYGKVTIVDREALIAAACECYTSVAK
jgi:CRP-like cAMP-binding protein